MLKWLISIMMLLSVVCGCMNGRMTEVSNAAIDSCSGAVTLVLALMGSMCLWSGIMRVADKAGVTAFISRLLSPVTRVLFPGLKKESKALRAVCMNITANLLGLGNAATPFGIEAMRHLSEEGGGEAGVANNHMIMLVVLNTASIQLLPTTIATLRLKHGSVSPLDILPPILVASFVSVLTGILMVKLFACKDRIFHHERKGKKNVNPGRVRKQGAI